MAHRDPGSRLFLTNLQPEEGRGSTEPCIACPSGATTFGTGSVSASSCVALRTSADGPQQDANESSTNATNKSSNMSLEDAGLQLRNLISYNHGCI